MTTSFPTSIDALTNPSASNTLNSPPHSAQHANANDAVEALEAKVGVDASAVPTSLDYLVKTASNPGHTHTLYVPYSVGTTKGDVLVHNGTTFIRRAVGTNGQVLTADSTQPDGVKWATPSTAVSPADVLVRSVGQIGFATSGSSTSLTGVGIMNTATSSATTSTRALSAHGIGILQATAATTGQQAVSEGGVASYRPDTLPQVTIKFMTSSVATVQRSYVGLTASTAAAELAGDAVINDKIGIQYSTARGDAAWQWVTCNGTTQTLATTGLAFATSTVYYLQIQYTTSSAATLTIRDSTTAVVATANLSTTMPVSNTNHRTMVGIQTLENVIKNQTFYYMTVVLTTAAL